MASCPQGVIVMTALVPTIGHQHLVTFASNFMRAVGGELTVIICSRSHEPVSLDARQQAFEDLCGPLGNVTVVGFSDDDAPQNDDGTQEFWDYWCDSVVLRCTSGAYVDYLFASEHYGAEFARQLEAQFIPCDIDRETYDVSGTDVRNNIFMRFDEVMPVFRHNLATTVTMFGAESVGKTTMARLLRVYPYEKHSIHIEEWARPYLERYGPEVTNARMETIALAQYSMQKSVKANSSVPLILQDTDLLSTIGYYQIYGGTPPPDLFNWFEETKSDLYLVLQSNIPFKKDILRYGGEVRESTDQFWIDLLEKYNCRYQVVKSSNLEDRLYEGSDIIDQFIRDRFKPISTFIRD